MSDVKSVLFVGVGGQGTILASKILTIGFIEHGYDVKMSEVHGMSQRGGSVSTQVRFGKKAARYARFLKTDGKMVVNTAQIPSLPVLSGDCPYPQGIVEELKKHVPVRDLDATQIATDLGNPRSANIVLLGALIEVLVDINLKAFDAGMEAARQ